jgi:hypothetical protein
MELIGSLPYLQQLATRLCLPWNGEGRNLQGVEKGIMLMVQFLEVQSKHFDALIDSNW